ncbi:sulfate reduction electron transfer complex DsrMKJOP subunit DsrO [Desulfofustis glycolicus]|uniref:Putative sulfite reductase-associated electron transfer protein DsrO n=1 Tax=Desulfofustis glycolicus DSM 9705 TaxID=1121409 RepID=A0A1M5UIF6_9BACT|nr:4Fe-4S dicluster domain-containing protein [Desulfofustis glycolicus]MCB2217468.1 4Fe-4S dicluster domain-containing protein [Desulfobulbaceae bacterium]SHH62767.1 putative sulfite reductase-associated electron transfer protein DsrO [Desulfofustis glycolicus DSM 9705]
MDNKRRKFLKMAGATVLAGIGAPAVVKLTSVPALASGSEQAAAGHGSGHGEEQRTGIRLGMVIDMRKFYGNEELLNQAIAACHAVHNVPEIPGRKSEIKWIWKTGFANAFVAQSQNLRSETVKNSQFPVLCNHCDNPSCVKVCPTKATFVNEKNGIVAMDYHRCIGCRFCMAACPFGARSFNWQDPRPFIKTYNPDFPSRMRGVVEKCNFCAERLALGLEPACVEACQGTGAMVFGDLNDPQSEVRKVLSEEFTIQRNAAAGTRPSVFYIV